MSQVIAGQGSDLNNFDQKIVLDFLYSRYPTTAYTPTRDKIVFSTMGFASKSYSISTELSGRTKAMISKGSYRVDRYVSDVIIHVWTKRNKTEIPIEHFNILQKLETIINTNTNNMPQGITSIELIQEFGEADIGFFSGGGGRMPNKTEQSVWHTRAIVQLVYFKAITEAL